MLRGSRLTGGSRRGRLLLIIPVIIAAAFITSGCDKLTGGGWIQSASVFVDGKATFSLSARCQTTWLDGIPTASFYDGQFEYDDHVFNPVIRVHGDVNPFQFGGVPGETCRQFTKTDLSFLLASGFAGTYRTQPQVVPALTGDFVVGVVDGGNPSSIDGDFICVSLAGGIDYSHCGDVQGGNITIQ